MTLCIELCSSGATDVFKRSDALRRLPDSNEFHKFGLGNAYKGFQLLRLYGVGDWHCMPKLGFFAIDLGLCKS